MRHLMTSVSRSRISLARAVATSIAAIVILQSAVGAQMCVGDCSEDGSVSSADLESMMTVALSGAAVSACVGGNPNGDDTIRVDEMLMAVNSAVISCTTSPTPTPTPPAGCDANLQISLSAPSGDFNGTAASFTATRVNTAIEQKAPGYIGGLHEVYNSTFNITECEQQAVRLRGIQIQISEVLGGLAAGQSFPISLNGSTDGSATAIVFYGEEGSGGDRVWMSSAGTVFIDTVSGGVVTVRVVDAAMTQTAGAGAGSFTLDASGQVTGFARQVT